MHGKCTITSLLSAGLSINDGSQILLAALTTSSEPPRLAINRRLSRFIYCLTRAALIQLVMEISNSRFAPLSPTPDSVRVLSGSRNASPLVSGVVDLLHKGADDNIALPRSPKGHPLFKALCARSAASNQLLVCFEALLTGPRESGAGSLSRQWLQWQPFISLVILDHGEGQHADGIPFVCLSRGLSHHLTQPASCTQGAACKPCVADCSAFSFWIPALMNLSNVHRSVPAAVCHAAARSAGAGSGWAQVQHRVEGRHRRLASQPAAVLAAGPAPTEGLGSCLCHCHSAA